MPPPIIFHHFHSPKVQNFWELEQNRRICFFKKWAFVLAHFWPFWTNFRIFWPFLAKLSENVPNFTISLQKSWKKLEKLSRNQKRQIWPPKCPKTYPNPKIAPKMGKGGQIWLKCTTVGLIMMIRYKKTFLKGSRIFVQIWHGITQLPLAYPHQTDRTGAQCLKYFPYSSCDLNILGSD